MSCSNRTLVFAAFALAFSSTIATAAHATTKTWVGGFSMNDWFDGNNWSPIGVPAATDDVINNGTPDLTASATVNSYTQGGSLMGVGTLDVNGMLTWNGGSMDGTGTTNANGGLSMPSGSLKIIRRPLNCNSNATWSGGQMQMGSGGVLTIASGAVFDVQLDSEMQFLGGAPHIDNAGTFQKSAGTGTTVFRSSIAFNNTGVVDVQTGTLELDGGGTDTGTYNASGGTMMFAGGTRNLGASASFTGGNMTFAGGTVNHAGSYSASTTAVTGGAVNFTGSSVSFTAVTLAGTLDLSTTDGPVNAATWVQSGGTLTGSSTLNVTGLLTWNGGPMDGTGTTNANGGLSMPSGSLKIIRRALNCNSNATWSGGQMQMGTGGVLTIASGTVFDIQVDSEMQFLGGAPHIDNAGTFQKSAGAGTTAFRSSIAFNNTGVVSVLAGTLELDSGGTDTGTYSAAGGTMMFAGGTRNLGASASMTGGNMTFAGGTVNDAGSYSASTTAVSGGTVNFTGSSVSFTDVTLNPGTLNLSTTGGPVSAATWVQSGGTLAGSSTLNVTGMLTWNGGPMDGTGTTNANGGLSMPTGLKIIRRVLNSNSAATWSGGQMQMGTGGVLTIATGTVFDIQVDSEMQFLGGGPHIDNAGTFQKSAGTGTTAFRSSIAFNNTGLVSVQTGTLEFDANYTQTAGVTRLNGGALTVFGAFGFQGGNLEGSGTLTANVSNNGGVLSPGLSPGQLTITSGYAQGASSAYNVEIGGLTAGTQFDKTVISGAATLAGALNISLINGYQPNVGDTFQIMTFGSRSGDFTTVTGTTIGTGKFFQEIAGPTSVTLVVVPALPTPTPTVTITPTPTATITPTGTATATPTTTVTPTSGPTTSATPTPIDHFTCYKAGATSGSVKFVGIGNPPGVSLQDSIETTQVALKKPKFLCAPTNALDQDPTAPAHPEHLTGYQIKGAAPGFTGSIQVIDMFNPSGTFVVAKKRSYLFVPTAKNLSATPPTPAAFATDHFECYKVTLASGAPRFVAVPAVTLDDQLGPMTVLVKKPQYLCNPANKNGEDPSASSHPAHLMCYQVKQTDAVKFVKHTALFVNNQFGPEELDAKKPSHLCVPATTP